MDNINQELQQIQANRYGVDIRVPIHDALAKLSGDVDAVFADRTGFPSDFATFSYDDIDGELWIIENEPKGSEVKDAIHDALYKLSLKIKEMNPAIVGLAPYPVTVTPVTESDDDLLFVDIRQPVNNPLSDLRDAIVSTNSKTKLFSNMDENIVYSEEELLRTLKIKDAFGNDFVTFTALYREDLEDPANNFWWHRVKVECDSTSITYPTTLSYRLDYGIMTPQIVYATKGKLLIRCGVGCVLFSRLDNGSLAVSISCGDRVMTDKTDPYSSLRTFSKDGDVSEYEGIGSYYGSSGSSIVMTPLIAEGDGGVAVEAYGVLSRVGVGEIEIGSRRFFACQGFAMEVIKDVNQNA